LCYVRAVIARLVLLALVLALATGCRREIAGGRADGQAIYDEVCARCHGPDGIPDPGNVARLGVRALTSERVRGQLRDEDIRRQILQGSPNRQMPSFAGALSDVQVDAIVRHVRALGPGEAGAAADSR
jgi:mono/diheme cytochrome c family protein